MPSLARPHRHRRHGTRRAGARATSGGARRAGRRRRRPQPTTHPRRRRFHRALGSSRSALAELPSRATRILIAVSDGAIAEVARVLADAGMMRGIALHTCGAVGTEALAPLAGGRRLLRRAPSAADHRHAGAGPRRRLPGAAFAIDGDAPALEWAGRIARLLGGEPLRIPADAAAPLSRRRGHGQQLRRRADGRGCYADECSRDRARRRLRAIGPAGRGERRERVEPWPGARRSPAPSSAATRRPWRVTCARWRARRHPCAGSTAAAGLHALDVAVRRGLAPDRARLDSKALAKEEKGRMAEATKRIRVPDLSEKKQRGEKIVVLTAYDCRHGAHAGPRRRGRPAGGRFARHGGAGLRDDAAGHAWTPWSTTPPR